MPDLLEIPDSTPLDHFQARLERSWETVREFLEERRTASHWAGKLSTSALSTATAVSALEQFRRARPDSALSSDVDRAIGVASRWLTTQQNQDGGFGDTDRSHSNIATTYLVLAAWRMTGFHERVEDQEQQAQAYVEGLGEWQGLRQRYGKDKTFVVPILSNCALAGMVPWRKVPALPFEAAWLPQDWYRLARMPVVSYAIPALVAIGQARHHFAPSRNPLVRLIRTKAVRPTLRVLEKMQPESGGYLEATPLTSFVLMNLAATGQANLPVANNCLKFLLDSQLEDGSWPIDTNLATWITNLALLAQSRRSRSLTLAVSPGTVENNESRPATLPKEQHVTPATVRWILRCQHTGRHPFTGAQPGGWGWTNLSGAVPDSDDTPAALLSLSKIHLSEREHPRLRDEISVAAARGLAWLLQLQNRDGGWPTFCRGWGQLPFDRSGTDLTAHAIRAFQAWIPRLDQLNRVAEKDIRISSIRKAMQRGLRFLAKHQKTDGSWLPLWFGNQDRAEEDNPIYGTSKVLLAYAELESTALPQARAGIEFLRAQQNVDGGWGGGASLSYQVTWNTHASQQIAGLLPYSPPTGENQAFSTIEETSLVLEALLACGGDSRKDASIMRGLSWLMGAIEDGHLSTSWPIGFYFAKLWYYEDLYPAVFSLGALGSALSQMPLQSSRAETPVSGEG